ncbi:MAG TPA: hypothetical protein VH351_05165 [Bryobacteraceae bacterium]|nr:hypothetical protein [Bryobacteraceae bacterium]
MKATSIAVSAVLFGLLAAPSPKALAQDSKSSSKLQVSVSYTGSGSVDDKHKVYVVLWDSPDFVRGGGSMPVAILPTSAKTGTVTFSSVQKSPAYVSTVFDSKGEWDGQSGPPPEGSSLGLYSKSPGEPAPIDVKAGETAKVTVTFDDSVKMPAQGGH